MKQAFKIYNASAGSGKTFTLVKSYLKIILSAKHSDYFKHLLAITFTNKAVGEMKTRVIDMLNAFSNSNILSQPNSMFSALVEELDMPAETLHKKSQEVLETLVHNYANFNVSTIDGFTHKLIRTFAYDLKLPLNFEVELDVDDLLSQAVDQLIAKAGTSPELTKVLVDFAIEKANDDKSWDISRDFIKIAKLLVNENDWFYVNTLKDKTLDDFKGLKQDLNKTLKTLEQAIVQTAETALVTIADKGLEHSDFSSGYLPKFLTHLSRKNFSVSFVSKWQEDLVNGNTIYPKRTDAATAAAIDSIQNELAALFISCRDLVFRYDFIKAILKNNTPLSVLNAIQQELEALKEAQNKMLISEFNTTISNEIKDQPTPFIYERLGEKFHHYFIDEFQDTSQMQWENLIPLVANAVEHQRTTEQGSLMLVGDAKQAIYRWRGGKAEQFIDLYTKTQLPFQVEQVIEDLEYNYRSATEIVNFNNGFFKFLSETAFSHPDYANLYGQAKQIPFLKDDGYVSVEFLDITKDDDKDDCYTQAVLETISNCKQNGFALGDICILTRTRSQGVTIANYLSDQGINVMSSETLLINNAPEVRLINTILQLLLQPNQGDLKIAVLAFIAEREAIADKHELFSKYIDLTDDTFFKALEQFDIKLNPQDVLQMPLYDLVEHIVRAFALHETSNAYIQYYLDEVLSYTQKQEADIAGFLAHFETKKDSLSIVSPKAKDAVEIMTIHKSKGLEFPVVIFPYADVNIYKEQEPKIWFPLPKDEFNGFETAYLNYNKNIANYGDLGHDLYTQHQSELELDNINILYVALTRPSQQLHIIGKRDISSKGVVNTKSYSGLLIQYLQHRGEYNDNQLSFQFGNPNKVIEPEESTIATEIQAECISTSKTSHNINIVTKSGTLWDTKQEQAMERGNLIHDIMALVKVPNDIDFAINDFVVNARILPVQAENLKQTMQALVSHAELSEFFTQAYHIENERDIISSEGGIIRPDRLAIKNQEVIIIDYKTGAHQAKYAHQLQHYQNVIEQMPYTVTKKLLAYINDTIEVVEVV